MIDLSCIQESQNEMIHNMEQFFDSLYFKQQDILESTKYTDNTYDDLMFEYACFQEGVVAPKLTDELDMYKFDNKHIIKCIRHFDKLIKELPSDPGVEKRKDAIYNKDFRTKKDREEDPKDKQEKYSIELTDERFFEYFEECRKIVVKPNSEFFKGIHELEQQFDCKIEFPEMLGGIMNEEKPKSEYIFGTLPVKNAAQLRETNLEISKKKGFQLKGLTITLIADIRALVVFTKSNNNTGGARLTSVILHEIFHNIAHMMNVVHSDFIKKSKDLLKSTNDDDTLPGVTAKMSNFLDKTMSAFGMPKIKSKEKKRAIGRLYVLSKIKSNPAALKKFEEDVKDDADPRTREDLEAYVEELKKSNHFTKIGSIFKAIGVLLVIIGSAVGLASGAVVGAVAGAIGVAVLLFEFSLRLIAFAIKKLTNVLIGKMDITEEYYCDLFAAMYQLPVSFSSYKRYIKLNEMGNHDLVEEYISGVRKAHDVINDVHPATFDRDKCSYNIAKQILSSNRKLKPEVRKYLEGIVADNEGIENINGEMSNKRAATLSPEASADLNRYLKIFADKTGTTVTESFIEYFTGGICNA